MNGFEINKIIAAIIFTVLVVFGIDKITDIIFLVEKPSEAAYKVEAPVVKTASSKSSGSESLNLKDFLARTIVLIFSRITTIIFCVCPNSNTIWRIRKNIRRRALKKMILCWLSLGKFRL